MTTVNGPSKKDPDREPEPDVELPDFIGKIEKATAGTVNFAGRFFRTLLATIVSPSWLNRDAQLGRLAPPNTFVAICALCGIRGIRRVVLAFLLLNASPFHCGSARYDTAVAPSLPSLAQEAALPSVSEVLIVALPLIASLIGLTHLLQRVRRWRGGPEDALVVTYASYAVGLQQVGFLIAAAPIAVLFDRLLHNSADTSFGPDWIPSWVGGAALLLLVVAAPSRVLLSSLTRGAQRARSRWRRAAGTLGRVALSVAFLTVTAVVTVAIAYPLALQQQHRSRQPRPMLQFQPAELTLITDSILEAAFVLRNDSYERRLLRTDSVEIVLKAGNGESPNGRVFHGRLDSWNGIPVRVVVLDSGAIGSGVGRFRLSAATWPVLGHTPSAPLPRNAQVQIAVRDVNLVEDANGSQTNVIVANHPPSP